ncbi:type II secretion system protein N [Castellaniella sp.]|uniref:type II secretion system protein N n=1 Tax=Castellaniella sp. TaxID=1955812 RepID=UPI002AFF9EFA|nr:type II secretion system protein N [Castellaniella sp.]
MMRWSRRFALWCVVAVLAALLVLPARWIMAWTQDTALVRVTDAQGSVWSGQARLAVGIPGQQRSLPDLLRWHFSLAGGPRLVLMHPWLRGPLDLSLSFNGLSLSGQSLRAPAAMLTTFHALFNSLDLGGELLLQWPDLHLGWRGRPQAVQANVAVLQAQWRAASSALSQVRPLGDYDVSITAAGAGGYGLQLRTGQGPLFLQGEGTLSQAGRFQFQGWAWADPDASSNTQAALRGLLSALGPQTGPDGRRSLRM